MAALPLLLGLALAGCVSPPRAAGPTVVGGPLPALGLAAAAATDPRATRGPLLMQDVRVERAAGDEVRWSVRVENPSRSSFAVNLVFVAGAGAGPLVSGTEDFRIDSRDRIVLGGTVRLPEASPAADLVWRLEYWVRLLPPPDRRDRQIIGA